jgi:diaminohydroxyphosphoribosylaminopyrimidine deaminase/5-amino-6-(5-phosphoribosylamino)uracil reductase
MFSSKPKDTASAPAPMSIPPAPAPVSRKAARSSAPSILAADASIFDSSTETIRVRNHDVSLLLAELYARGVKHLLVEGGPTVASAFVRSGLVDEFVTYLAPQLIGGPGLAVTDLGVDTMASAYQLAFREVLPLGADLFIRAARRN